MSESTNTPSEALSLSTPDDLKVELGFAQVEEKEPAALDPEIVVKADQFVAAVIAIQPDDPEDKASKKALIDSMGVDVQRASSHRSKMLQQPIKQLMERGGEGGPVADALISLKQEIDELNPNDLDFSVSGVAKALSWIPGIGNKIEAYFLKYASAQELIDQIIKSLEAGRDTLERDNKTLAQDQVVMQKLTQQLSRLISMGQVIDEKLSYQLEREIAPEDPRHKFISEELVFPLRQRIQDLQQQLVVNQQGILSIELIIRNNRELIRGVGRAINVTVSALQVAVTVALALANQKLVLDKIESLNRTTSKLIAGTASRLRTQGVEIHKQAASTSLDMEALKSSFNDITAAMDDIARYRQEALPQMAVQIQELDTLSKAGEEAIQRMRAGSKIAPKIDSLDLEVQ
ncbi:Toxic anion resistance protein (TelA) [Verrucomicrobiia bacterium DG1235]|nr:Toxic anion resistance protein (TelA) [Verrucomicrobiae bacterium DG1235]